MTQIISGSAATFPVTVMLNGSPVALSGTVNASVYSMDLITQYVAPFPLDEDDAGSDWANGVAIVALADTDTADFPLGDVILVVQGAFGVKRFKLVVESLTVPVKSSLFIKDIAVDEIRSDRLMLASAGAMGDITVTDDYIWEKIKAAESEMAHTLRVPLVPTKFFNDEPTEEELGALAGMEWELESPYDYQAEMFAGDRWGYIVTRQKPLIRIDLMRFVYPTEDNGHFDIPLNWILEDKKYGHIRIVPTSNAILTGMAGMVMMNLAGGRTIPGMVHVEYVAGLENAQRDYPELIDCIKKKAVLKIISDMFLPQSGSISADGMSESISVDMDKYHQAIDHIINGNDGSNGGLMAKIHGIRMMVM